MRICLTALIFSVFAGTAMSQEVSKPEDPALIVNRCLSSPPSMKPDDSGIIAAPIEKVFVEGRTRTVSELLCIIPGSFDELGEFGWYWINRTTRELTKTYASFEVEELRPSPNGKYLAVKLYTEGVAWIDVTDLPSLLRDRKYDPIDTVGKFPGSVSIQEWKGEGEELIVTSNVFLSQPAGRNLDLASEERFSVNIQTGATVALSPSLRDPAAYFCAMLADYHTQQFTDRASVAEAIASLGQRAGIPCLERALATETDETIRSDIRAAIEELTALIALQKECLSGNLEELKGKEIVTESVTTLFVDGQSTAIDMLLCSANAIKDKRPQVRWLRFDRSVPDPVGETLESGDSETEVQMMRASPDGKYLAVEYRPGYVKVVDLTKLLTTRRYKSIQVFDGSFQQWDGTSLEVASDSLLSHAPTQTGDELHILPLLSKESFLWDSARRTVTPKWNGLQNPLRYYCEGLAAPEIEKRRIAASGLRLLNDKDAAACIQTALATESDESLQRDLRELLSAFSPR